MVTSIESSNKNNTRLAEDVHMLRAEVAENQRDIEIIDRVVNSRSWKQRRSKPSLHIINHQNLLSNKK